MRITQCAQVMVGSSVVYVHEVTCASCGQKFSGYAQPLGDGSGSTACPKCGAGMTVKLPEHYVVQIPPPGYDSVGHHLARHSHYPSLYIQPKHAPRLDLADLLKIFYSPTKALCSLYLSTNLQRAMAIVLVFSILYAVASTVVTAGMADVIGYDAGDAFQLGIRGVVVWVLSLLAFLIFATVAAVIAKGVFGGRGERGATITLSGYCFPAYVLLAIVLLLIFKLGFEGLDLTRADSWTSGENAQAIRGGVVLLVAAIVGLVWLLWVTSRAVSVANDISMGEAALTTILSSAVAGIVYNIVDRLVSLPLGLWF